MENKKGRTLAYTLAKVIHVDELAKIAGGGGGQQMTSRLTTKVTMPSGEVVVDVTPD